MASLAMLTPYANLNAAENPSELFYIGGPVAGLMPFVPMAVRTPAGGSASTGLFQYKNLSKSKYTLRVEPRLIGVK